MENKFGAIGFECPGYAVGTTKVDVGGGWGAHDKKILIANPAGELDINFEDLEADDPRKVLERLCLNTEMVAATQIIDLTSGKVVKVMCPYIDKESCSKGFGGLQNVSVTKAKAMGLPYEPTDCFYKK